MYLYSFLGIPGMRNLAGDIVRWPEELGEDGLAASLWQVLECLNMPPNIDGGNPTATRGSRLSKWWKMHPLVPLGSDANLAHQG